MSPSANGTCSEHLAQIAIQSPRHIHILVIRSCKMVSMPEGRESASSHVSLGLALGPVSSLVFPSPCSGGGQSPAPSPAPTPKPQPQSEGMKLCKICEESKSVKDFGKKKYCTVCMRNVEAAGRRAKSQKQMHVWKQIQEDDDVLRDFLRRFEAEVGPSRGSGSRRGGLGSAWA